MKRWPFRFQILLLGALPALIVWIVMTLHTAYNSWSHLLKEHQQHGEILVQQIAPGCEFPIFSGDMDTLRTYLHQTARQPRIERIEVYDTQFHLLAQVRDSRSSSTRLVQGTVFTAPIYASMLSIDEWSGSDTKPPQKLGSVALTLSNEHLRTSRQQIILEAFWAGASAFMVALLLLLILSRPISLDFSRLKLSMRKVSSGNLTPLKQEASNQGELGEMSQQLEQITSTLERNRREALAAYEALELHLSEKEKSTRRPTSSIDPERNDLH